MINSKSKDGVIVIVKKKDKILLIKQSRPELNINSIEFPGGGIENDHKHITEVAKKEVKEETGVIIKNCKQISKIFPSIHLRNWVYVFIAEFYEQGQQSVEEDEEISEILWITKNHIEDMISNNQITSAQTIAAFEIAKRYIN